MSSWRRAMTSSMSRFNCWSCLRTPTPMSYSNASGANCSVFRITEIARGVGESFAKYPASGPHTAAISISPFSTAFTMRAGRTAVPVIAIHRKADDVLDNTLISQRMRRGGVKSIIPDQLHAHR